MAKLLKKAGRLLYPRVCPVCEDIIKDEPPYICGLCEGLIDYMNGPRCVKCSKPLSGESGAYCEACGKIPRGFDAGYALMRHDERTKNIVYELKYGGVKDNAQFIGAQAARLLGREILGWGIDAVIPVPLHKKREHERGFNQTRLIAEQFLKFLPENNIILDTQLLRRTSATARLKELSPEERQEEIRGAFEAGAVPYKRVLLVDDIFTTGATLSECARVLRRAGARKVFFLTATIVPGE